MAMNFFGSRPVMAIVVARDCLAGVIMLRGETHAEHVIFKNSPSPTSADARALLQLLHGYDTKTTGLNVNTWVRRIFKPRLRVVLAAPYGRLKRVESLPKAKSREVRLNIIREAGDRIFVHHEQGLLIADEVDDQSWAAIYDRNFVQSLSEEAKNAKVSIQFIATTTALTLPEPAENVERDEISNETLELARSLTNSKSIPLAAWRRRRSTVSRVLEDHGARIITTTIIALIITIGAFGPLLFQAAQLRGKEELLVSTSRVHKQYADSAEKLRLLSAALDEINEFRRQRRSVMQTLAILSNALPENTFVEQLRVDSTGGTLTIAGPGAGRAAIELEHNHAFASIELTSPIQWIGSTNSPIGSQRADSAEGEPSARVTIRFRHGGAISRASTATHKQ